MFPYKDVLLKTMNNKVNHIYERALRLVYSDYSSKFDELIKKNVSVSIPKSNIPKLAIKIDKFFNGLSPSIAKNSFQVNTNDPYSLMSMTVIVAILRQ